MLFKNKIINKIKNKDDELYNYLNEINSPLFFFELIKIFFYISKKKYLLPISTLINKNIYKARLKKKNKKSNTYDSNFWIQLPALNYNNESTAKERHNFEFYLASKKFSLKHNNKINWDHKYKDPENTMSLHRFGWLLINAEKIKKNILANYGFDLIDEWINNNIYSKSKLKWDSYTTSERLIYWSIFFSLIKKTKIPNKKTEEKFAKAILIHLECIYENLDYWGSESNNHLLNNGRALYIGGKVINNKYFSAIGKKILKKETDSLVPKGVLKEGSSHYQLLITKSYLELIIFSMAYNDKPFEDWLKKRISRMLDCCSIFHINKEKEYIMPFIGDISPDFPPQRFLGSPFINTINSNKKTIKSHWSLIWDKSSYLNQLNFNNSDKVNNGLINKNQWIKYQNDDFTIFSIMKNNDIKSHTHQDEGSFSLYYNKIPVIIDPGQKNYIWKNKINNSLSKGFNHNTILINGFSSNFSKVSNMYEYFKRKNTLLNTHENGFELEINGFRAIGKWVKWYRKFSVKNKKISINDSFNNDSFKRVDLNFIINNEIDLTIKKRKIYAEKDNLKFIFKSIATTKDEQKINPRYKISDGIKSDYYGDESKCKIINISYNYEKPIKIYSEFNFNEMIY